MVGGAMGAVRIGRGMGEERPIGAVGSLESGAKAEQVANKVCDHRSNLRAAADHIGALLEELIASAEKSGCSTCTDRILDFYDMFSDRVLALKRS